MPTLAELRAIVRTDPLLNSTTVISDADVNTKLKEGAVQFAKDGDAYIVAPTAFNTAASTSDYVLSGASPKVTGFLDIYWPAGGIVYTQSSGVVKMAPNDFKVVSELWLNRESPGWRSLTASDTLQYVAFSYDSSGYLILKTVPAASTTTPTIQLWIKSRGTDMSADANYPYTNSTTNLVHIEPYQKGIAHYASYVIHRDVTQLQAKADHFLQLYNAQAAACKEAQERIFAAEVHGLRQSAMLMASQSFGG